MPTVSVVIPTYNRADVLPRAIDSVLDQTFDDFELIVVDDHSTDNTRDVVAHYEDPRIRYERHDVNKNGAAARNTGIERARGEFVAFLDSDDRWLPEKLTRQVATLEAGSDDIVAAYCGVKRRRDSPIKQVADFLFSETWSKEGGEEILVDVLSSVQGINAGSTLLVRKAVIADIDGFDDRFERHQDLELLVRLLQCGDLVYVDEEMVMLYDSGYPSPEKVVEAKRLLLDKYDDLVAELERDGYTIGPYHEFGIAKAYLRAGNYRRAIFHLRRGRPPNSRQFAALVWSAVAGLREVGA